MPPRRGAPLSGRARLVVLYADATSFDLTDPADARHLVETHVLPGLPAATH